MRYLRGGGEDRIEYSVSDETARNDIEILKKSVINSLSDCLANTQDGMLVGAKAINDLYTIQSTTITGEYGVKFYFQKFGRLVIVYGNGKSTSEIPGTSNGTICICKIPNGYIPYDGLIFNGQGGTIDYEISIGKDNDNIYFGWCVDYNNSVPVAVNFPKDRWIRINLVYFTY